MPYCRAYRIHAYGGGEALRLEEVPVPSPAAGEVVLATAAVGLNPADYKLRSGAMRGRWPLTLPATLGIEVAGRVHAAAEGATPFAAGQRAFGMLAGVGAFADYVAVPAANLVATPPGLSDVEAAALPVAASTAAQALAAAGPLPAGAVVLVVGAAGAVGGFVVQLARAAGARVVAVASASSLAYVRGLGAERAIDRQAEAFEDVAGEVDVVIDLVGDEVVRRCWGVLRPAGILVSAAAVDLAAVTPAGRRSVRIAARPDASRLAEVAAAVAAGRLQSRLAEVAGLADLPAALERLRTGHPPGKIVVDWTR